QLNIDAMTSYRRLRAEDRITDDPRGDIFLVVDGWRTLREELDDLESEITRIARLGLRFGIHVIVAADRWNDFRPALRDALGAKIELKLSDSFDSIVGRRLAESVPASRPGRGITADGLHLLTALPRIDGHPETEDLSEGVADLVTRIGRQW